MRYGWKKAFLLCRIAALYLAFGGLMGCQDTAVLYDSSGAESAEFSSDGEEADGGSPAGENESAEEESSAKEKEKTICVYVCGEVEAPGVYELLEDSRIVDAIAAAGGMTDEASDTYLNLAECLSDGQMIVVPSAEQAEVLAQEEQEAQSGLVNLNTASAEELMTLSGVGESKAQAILNYREEHGGFKKPEDLMEIPGIKEGVFEKIKDQITV